MLELTLAALLIAALLWQAHRREERAKDLGFIDGFNLASQQAAERQRRLANREE